MQPLRSTGRSGTIPHKNGRLGPTSTRITYLSTDFTVTSTCEGPQQFDRRPIWESRYISDQGPLRRYCVRHRLLLDVSKTALAPGSLYLSSTKNTHPPRHHADRQTRRHGTGGTTAGQGHANHSGYPERCGPAPPSFIPSSKVYSQPNEWGGQRTKIQDSHNASTSFSQYVFFW